MKEKIEQLAKGQFEYQLPCLLFSEEKISISAEAGKAYEGCFYISNSKKRRMKGILYSDSRMFRIQKGQFIGEDNEISYVFHSEYAKAGESYKGVLYIITDVGEAALPYEVQVVFPCFHTSIGEVRDLFQFTSLARENWEEAERLFFDSRFPNIFFYHNKKYKLLHQVLASTKNRGQAMEEFLVAAGKKMAVDVVLETTEFSYKAGNYDFMDKLVFHKSGWGYTAFRIECDAEFIQPERTGFTAEDFAGGHLEIGFLVKAAGLKTGVHSAKIRIFSAKQQMEARVVCHMELRRKDSRQLRQKKHRAAAQLTLNYLLFRSGQRDVKQYVDEAERLLVAFRQEDTRENKQKLAARLYQIHIWQVAGRNAAVKNALSEFQKQEGEEEVSGYPELKAGLYYLSAMSKKPAFTVEEAALKIRPLYRENLDKWLLLWFLLHLDRAYQDARNRYEAVRSHFVEGAPSPIMLLEALMALKEEPSLLRCLDSFELRLLQFAAKYQSLTKELVQQMIYLAARQKNMPPILYHILTECYEKDPSQELLDAICTLIVRNGERSPRYFKWLKLGVENQLRITELIEFYLSCMKEDIQEGIHPNVYLYFTYQSDLSSWKKELLYASLIRHKEEYAILYKNYQEEMKNFASSQLQAGVISRNMAVIYNDCFKDSLCKEEDYWHLAQMAFSHIITCSLERMPSVSVVHPTDIPECIIPLARGRAVINLYRKDAEIFLIDEQGCRYPAKNLQQTGNVRVEKLIDLDRYLWGCYERGSMELPLLLHLEEEAAADAEHSMELPGIYKKLLNMPWLSEEKKQCAIQSLLEQAANMLLDPYLKQIPFEQMGQKEREKAVEVLIDREFSEEAGAALEKFGEADTAAKKLPQLASQLLDTENIPQADEFLAELAQHGFSAGECKESVIDYLCRYYHGSTQQMIDIWKEAKTIGLDTENLEESLLGQALFAESCVQDVQGVFLSYCQHGTNRKLIHAYLSYYAYQYLIKDLAASQEIFDIMGREELFLEQSEICILALLKYYSEEETLTERQLKFVDCQMRSMEQRGMILPFYCRFAGRVKLPECMYDKYYIEYRANPESLVKIHYSIGSSGNFHVSLMDNVCYGIFIKSFILFEAESLQYYITQEQDGKETVSEKKTVTINSETRGQYSYNRYDSLNLIIAAHRMHDDRAVISLLENYIRTEYEAKRLFHAVD